MTYANDKSLIDCHLEVAELDAVSGGVDRRPNLVDRFFALGRPLEDPSTFQSEGPFDLRAAIPAGVAGYAGTALGAVVQGASPYRALTVDGPIGGAITFGLGGVVGRNDDPGVEALKLGGYAAGAFTARVAPGFLDAIGGSSTANVANATSIAGLPLATGAGVVIGGLNHAVGTAAEYFLPGSGAIASRAAEAAQLASYLDPRAAIGAAVETATGALIDYFKGPASDPPLLASTGTPEASAAVSGNLVGAVENLAPNGNTSLEFGGDRSENWSALNPDEAASPTVNASVSGEDLEWGATVSASASGSGVDDVIITGDAGNQSDIGGPAPTEILSASASDMSEPIA